MESLRRLRVLVVEDHDELRHSLAMALELGGFEVHTAATGADAMARLDARPDVVLLDRDLPDGDGLSLIPRIRAVHRVHIIILSGAGSEDDRVAGLQAGADDYVTKPASVRELAARLQSVGRQLASDHHEVLAIGPLTIDAARRLVILSGRPIAMTRRELDLLEYLARNAPRVVPRAELLAAVWSSSVEWQSASTVTEHVRRVRLKIEDDPTSPRWITSVRGVGYRFNPDASATAMPTHAATVVVEATQILHATAAAADLVGAVDPVALHGRSVMDFIAPQSIAATTARRATLASGTVPRPEIITLVRIDGTELHVEIASTPTVWEGRPASQVTLWPLAGETTRLRQLVTGISTDVADAIVIVDPRGRIESFNAAAEALYGWEEDEVIGRGVDDVMPWVGPRSARDRAYEELHSEGAWHGNVLHSRRDGTHIDVTATATLLRDHAGNTVGAISVNRPTPSSVRSGRGDDAVRSADLANALERDELRVVYQPIVRLDDRSPVGWEALVRWQHPTRGLLLPADFIETAEQTGLIIDIGGYVLQTACRQLRDWRDQGHDAYVAVNLSARQVADPRLGARVQRELVENDLPSGALWLEVTETALVEDIDVATETLAALSAFGARISIDDFGTGWASLTYLHHFPVDALKIDRIFVNGLGARPSDTAIVRSIIALAQELEIGVVAEGIETEEQLAALGALGATTGQGYLFGRPEPAQPAPPGS